MKKFFKWFGISLAIVIVLAVAGPVLLWKILTFSETHEWQQKITVQVETPAGLVSGSSVTHVVYTFNPNFFAVIGPSGGNPYKLTGEAVVVEVLPGKYLFALLTGAESKGRTEIISRVFSPKTANHGKKDAALRYHEGLKPGDKMVLPVDFYPMLVTFTDINDPASVKRAEPTNLERYFGAGVTLKAIVLEITDEPVTEGWVDEVLGWWEEYRRNHYRLNGKKCVACPVKSENIADLIGPSLFKIIGK